MPPSPMCIVGYKDPGPPEYPGHSPYQGSSIIGSRQAYGRPNLSTAVDVRWATIKKKIATRVIKRPLERKFLGDMKDHTYKRQTAPMRKLR